MIFVNVAVINDIKKLTCFFLSNYPVSSESFLIYIYIWVFVSHNISYINVWTMLHRRTCSYRCIQMWGATGFKDRQLSRRDFSASQVDSSRLFSCLGIWFTDGWLYLFLFCFRSQLVLWFEMVILSQHGGTEGREVLAAGWSLLLQTSLVSVCTSAAEM